MSVLELGVWGMLFFWVMFKRENVLVNGECQREPINSFWGSDYLLVSEVVGQADVKDLALEGSVTHSRNYLESPPTFLIPVCFTILRRSSFSRMKHFRMERRDI